MIINYYSRSWTQTLEKVVRMEIPSPTHQPQRDSRLSQSFEASDTHSRPDSFESYSSESLNEDSLLPPQSLEQQQM